MRDSEDCFAIDVIENLVEEVCSLNQPEDLVEINREEEHQPTTIEALEGLSLEPSIPSTESPP